MAETAQGCPIAQPIGFDLPPIEPSTFASACRTRKDRTLARYRKRPVTIDAEQILEGQPLPSHVYADEHGLAIDTLEGTMRPVYGDWRIIGVKGEPYSCRDGIFQETYEPTHVGGSVDVTYWQPWSAQQVAEMLSEWRLAGQMEAEDQEAAIDG